MPRRSRSDISFCPKQAGEPISPGAVTVCVHPGVANTTSNKKLVSLARGGVFDDCFHDVLI
ncbi:MAG: hypothetical protein OXD45_01850 [Rhodobacteraceae bacterium]|nr:hypothetical protein [Paracoccaceae bacterium]